MAYVRRTSKEAYDTIRINGLLSHRRWQAYDYVYHNGPCMAWDAWKAIAPNCNVSSIMGRFSELERMGVFVAVGDVVNEATGMKTMLWDVTDSLPVEVEKRKTKLEQCREDLKVAEDRNFRLVRLLKNVYSVIEDDCDKAEIAREIADELGIERPLVQGWLF